MNKFERCVLAVKASTGYYTTKNPKYNPWAICHAALKKSSKKVSKRTPKKRGRPKNRR